MITPAQLFRRRLKAEWKFQIKAWRMAVDWIVALYIVVPALAFGVYQYMSWWRKAPEWFALIPAYLPAVAIYGICMIGTVRYMLEEGDQLFIWQRPLWHQTLVRQGIIYSVLFYGASTVLLVAIFAPILVDRSGYTMAALVDFALFAIGIRLALFLAFQWIGIRFSGISGFFSRTALFILAGWIFRLGAMVCGESPALGWTAAAAALGVLVLLIRSRMNWKGTLIGDIYREREERFKYVSLMLTASVMEKKPKLRLKFPLLFPRSGRLFRSRSQVNGITEAAVKRFFRSRTGLKLYFQMIAICSIGVLLLPGTARMMLWLGSSLLLAYQMKNAWTQAAENPFLGLFPWKEEARIEAMKKTVFLTMLPGYLIISLAVGLRGFSLWGALVLLPAGAVVSLAAAAIMTAWHPVRSGR